MPDQNRPNFVTWAVYLIVLNAVGGMIFAAFMPDIDDRGTVLTVSVIAGALMLLTAWLAWNGNLWGTVGAIALQVLNILAALPWFIDMDDAAVGVGVVISIVLSLATIGLLLMRDSRTYWRR